MEKEKKSRTTKKATTPKQSSPAELVAPKKTATRKKTSPIRINENGAEPKKAAARKKVSQPKVTQMRASHDEIAKLAHRYFIERGHQHGHHEEDWLRAERELRGKAS